MTPPTMLFVNLPVTDIPRTRAFFTALGFSFQEAFCDDTALCMKVNEHAFYMLLSHAKFSSFTDRPLVTPAGGVPAFHALTVGSREEADALLDRAVAAGGEDAGPAQDLGFMYSRSFRDLDGHTFEIFWMDPSAIPAEEG